MTGQEFEVNRIPRNLSEMADYVIEGARFGVYSWTPERDGKGVPTQVHLHFSVDVPGMGEVLFISRMKSHQAVDRCIRALRNHRNHVWPQHRGE